MKELLERLWRAILDSDYLWMEDPDTFSSLWFDAWYLDLDPYWGKRNTGEDEAPPGTDRTNSVRADGGLGAHQPVGPVADSRKAS